MCGGGIVRQILPLAADALAVATGNPELIPAIQGGSTLLQGGSIGDAAKNAGLAFAGQELLPAFGNVFQQVAPETASSLGITGGANTLTDILGQTTGGGSIAGPGTIGGDLMGNFTPGSGLSSLYGGTPQPSADLSATYNGINTAPASAQTAAEASSPANAFAASPGTAASTPFSTGGAASGFGGGTSGAGFDLGTAGESTALPSATGIGSTNFDLNGNPITSGTGIGAGVGAPQSSGGLSSLFSSPTNVGSYSYDIGGNPVGLSQLAATSPEYTSLASTPRSNSMSGLASLFGGGATNQGTGGGANLLNGLLRSGLGGLFTNTNQSGYQGIQNAANQAGQYFQPYVQTGTAANNQLAALYGLNGNGAQAAAQANWQNTPGYQFALQQGINAVNADAARKGQLLSGNNQYAIQQYGTGLANQTYNNYLQNLANQAAQGSNAAGNLGTAMLTGANAGAQGKQATANNQNATTAGVLQALFPSGGLNIAGIPLTSTSANNGILGFFS